MIHAALGPTGAGPCSVWMVPFGVPGICARAQAGERGAGLSPAGCSRCPSTRLYEPSPFRRIWIFHGEKRRPSRNSRPDFQKELGIECGRGREAQLHSVGLSGRGGKQQDARRKVVIEKIRVCDPDKKIRKGHNWPGELAGVRSLWYASVMRCFCVVP